jgi:MoxR-like ATPase
VTVANPAEPSNFSSSEGELTEHLLTEIEQLGVTLARVREMIGRVIFGQTEVVDQSLITLLAGGHGCWSACPAWPRRAG